MELEQIKQLLLKKGVRLMVTGCGCCSSPWMTIEIDGVVVLNGHDVKIDMIGDEIPEDDQGFNESAPGDTMGETYA